MKSLAKKPNLEFLKKAAKALRALHRRGDKIFRRTVLIEFIAAQHSIG